MPKGAGPFNLAAVFGSAANIITLGQSGKGGATLMSTAGVILATIPIVVAAGTGGTSYWVRSSARCGGTYSGTVTLNGNLDL